MAVPVLGTRQRSPFHRPGPTSYMQLQSPRRKGVIPSLWTPTYQVSWEPAQRSGRWAHSNNCHVLQHRSHRRMVVDSQRLTPAGLEGRAVPKAP